MSDNARRIRLLQGEALFSVEHDPSRPFLVQSSDAVIQAIGTRFVVYQRVRGTRVAVIEGLVQVSEGNATSRSLLRPSVSSPYPSPSPPSTTRKSTTGVHFLAAGQAAEVSKSGSVLVGESIDAAKAVAWRQRRLVFEDDTLGDIAAEFNRYNASVKIRVVGERALNERFSGTFDADAPEAMMQALTGDSALHVERSGDHIIIWERHRQKP
jgi:transmembrane sensor